MSVLHGLSEPDLVYMYEFKTIHGVQRRMISVDIFFVFFRLLCFALLLPYCDLVHAVEATYGLL